LATEDLEKEAQPQRRIAMVSKDQQMHGQKEQD
jgi:hypothetical protein